MRPSRASLAFALAALALVAAARSARAQCDANASSCVDCHEVQGRRPVLSDAQPWHRDHGYGDLCVACHAGDPAAAAQDAAHAGLRAPLADPAASCAGCHAADAAARADRYLAVLRATPPAAAPPPPPAAPAPAPAAAASTADRVLAATSLLLAAVLAWQLARRRRDGARAWIAWLRAPTWSPYTAGAGLGLVVAVALGLLGRPLSASGAFDKLAAYPGRALFPSSPYYAHVMTPAITWQVWLMIGVLGGAFASSRLSGQAHLRWLPDAWVPRFGPRRGPRLLLAFAGAALVQIGAGIAGGCTSGLAISGGALLAPAAFVFMAGMFAGGIPTAWCWHRRRS